MFDSEGKDYLTRHLEQNPNQPTSLELEEAMKKFCNPIEDVDFTGEGEVVLRQGDVSLSFSWTPTYLSNLNEGKSRIIDYYGSVDGLDILNNFKLTNAKTGAVVTQADILPPDITVVFDPYHNEPWTSAYFNTDKLILLSESPNIPGAVASLFHEAGHADDFKKRPEIIPSSEKIEGIVWKEGSEKLTKQEAEEFLRYERNAWAFALRKLKPFIGGTEPFPQEPLLRFVHAYSLYTKSQAIRNQQPHLKV